MHRFSIVVASAVLISFAFTGTAEAQSAEPSFYVTISDGTSVLPGDSVTAGFEGLIRGFQYHHGRSRSFDAVSGDAAAGFRSRVLTIIKPIDASTPLLHQSMSDGTVFPTVNLQFVRVNASVGALEMYFEISLRNAEIVDITNWAPADPVSMFTARESISMTYETITWEHLASPQTTHEAPWSR